MTPRRYSPGPAPIVALLFGAAACGGGAKPIPQAPPSTIAVVADEDQPGPAGAGDAGPSGDEPRGAAPPLRRDDCGVAIAVSMEGLMVPGGVERMQRALVARELLSAPYRDGQLDRPTLEAILELQRRSELPAVGLPSYASVRALGIDPSDVFVSGSSGCGGAS